MRGLILLLISAMFLPAFSSLAEPVLRVRYIDASDMKHNPNNDYFGQLLKLALDKTAADYGPYELSPLDIDISQRRHFLEIGKGRVDVFWTMTTDAREQQARPVRVPLMKGVYGLRLLALNRADASSLESVKGIEDLRGIRFIQGRDWPDTQVFRCSG